MCSVSVNSPEYGNCVIFERFQNFRPFRDRRPDQRMDSNMITCPNQRVFQSLQRHSIHTVPTWMAILAAFVGLNGVSHGQSTKAQHQSAKTADKPAAPPAGGL